MKLPKIPTIYYCDEINEIVLITPMSNDLNVFFYRLRFDDCCYEDYLSLKQIKNEWPNLVKLGEL